MAQAKEKIVEVIVLGLFHAISNWQAGREEKHRAHMEEQGKCPECHGRGFPITYSAVYPAMSSVYTTPADCLGCSGSGLYSDWVETNQEHV
ncbi:methionine aminopeptidase [Priestia abyssalis]|uniref:methionine aminopeptidase n=1 Tax=Priestia abyssalis TaxID=1221450 RepID=UPI001F3F4045|nr:methionine aminopeptidase [Priestia abyssalis]